MLKNTKIDREADFRCAAAHVTYPAMHAMGARKLTLIVAEAFLYAQRVTHPSYLYHVYRVYRGRLEVC